MEDQNIQIVKECIEQITNAKQLGRIYEYYSPQCVFHTPPYVGMGIFPDATSGEKVVIKQVAKNSPAAGVLQIGDELLSASDATSSWQGYKQLRSGLWGQGQIGTPVKVTLLRNGQKTEVTVTRGRVEGFDSILQDDIDNWKHFLLEEIPDFKTEIQKILASGDLVAYFAINSGTSSIYHQSAVWSECNILRLENGKIVEWWGVEDTISQWRQFGFQINEPG